MNTAIETKKIDILRNLDLNSTPKEILESFDPKELIENHQCDPSSKSYERDVLYKSDDIEIVMCHWKSQDASHPHFHPDKECWFKCLKGELTEVRCCDEHKRLIKSGEVSYIDDTLGSHQISNLSDCCTFTLHLYKQTNQ